MYYLNRKDKIMNSAAFGGK